MEIRVYERVTMRPRGDRDTRTHPSSAFEVVLVNGDRRSTVYRNDQFDHWWTSINGTREEYLNKAMDAAESLAETLGACEIVGVNATKDEVRAEELRRKIAKDTEELRKLEEKLR